VNRGFRPALKAAKLKRIRSHDLRHTYASLLIANGESIKVVQRLLGHSSVQLTLDVYAHLLPEDFEGVAGRLSGQVFAALTAGA
jgi:integrase